MELGENMCARGFIHRSSIDGSISILMATSCDDVVGSVHRRPRMVEPRGGGVAPLRGTAPSGGAIVVTATQRLARQAARPIHLKAPSALVVAPLAIAPSTRSVLRRSSTGILHCRRKLRLGHLGVRSLVAPRRRHRRGLGFRLRRAAIRGRVFAARLVDRFDGILRSA